jgi:hypothetical protein
MSLTISTGNDFIPIAIIFLFASFPNETILFSETSLGKFFAIVLIAYYTILNPVYGIFVCAIVLMYYHMEMSRGIWSVEKSKLLKESMQNMQDELESISMEKTMPNSAMANNAKLKPSTTMSFRDTRLMPHSISTGKPSMIESSLSVEPFQGRLTESQFLYTSSQPQTVDHDEMIMRHGTRKPELLYAMQSKDSNEFIGVGVGKDINSLFQPWTSADFFLLDIPFDKVHSQHIMNRVFDHVQDFLFE